MRFELQIRLLYLLRLCFHMAALGIRRVMSPLSVLAKNYVSRLSSMVLLGLPPDCVD